MQIYVPPAFAKLARKEDISDYRLLDAVVRAERGQIDAQLAPHLIKQRIPRPGQGRARGLRGILAYKRGTIAVPLFLFPKSGRANLTAAEQEAYAAFAAELAGFTDADFARLVRERGWRRIDHDEATIPDRGHPRPPDSPL